MSYKPAIRLALALSVAFVMIGACSNKKAVVVDQKPVSTPALSGSAPGAQKASGVNHPGDVPIQVTMVAEGLDEPVNIAAPEDGSGRIFVVGRLGQIRIIRNGKVLPSPFLDISGNVQTGYTEQGLLGLAFHPEYKTNGRFFVYYITGSGAGVSRLSEFHVSASNPDMADPGTEKILLEFDQPYRNHNGGKLAFGPDGYLYLGLGDGGSGGDPHGNGQNIDVLFGKLLRLDINASDGSPYVIPSTNPFAGRQGARPEIWAFGLRNPWQFSFDRKSGDLYIADVGQDTWEEIDFQPANAVGGENYGWNLMEGSHCFPAGSNCASTGVLPVAEYDHQMGCSVTGIGIYRGAEYTGLEGIYFYGDYCSGRIWGLAKDESGQWVSKELLQTNLQITGAGEDEAGNIYITSFKNPSGSIWKLGQK